MIKKIFLFLTLIFSINAFACVCSGTINSSYSKFENHIKNNLNGQTEALKQTIKTIKKNQEIIDKKNKTLLKTNKLLEDNLLKREKMIFNLIKQNQLI